eukprot:CAMPEP_0178387450 /NCGR_PEP_ID=MMETSP0689_2-20121128/9081_1 /TAXON_ID=160604 /ORGANISM="Amphidinium massartii, Strain CS-259" /LENGTH=608 /DNA_ID=CAMNT_0020007817 /DNA_START=1 /DNA_END=1823 /DNA_ORIENTATION=+
MRLASAAVTPLVLTPSSASSQAATPPNPRWWLRRHDRRQEQDATLAVAVVTAGVASIGQLTKPSSSVSSTCRPRVGRVVARQGLTLAEKAPARKTRGAIEARRSELCALDLVQLRRLLEERGLRVTGTKEMLIDRLVEHDTVPGSVRHEELADLTPYQGASPERPHDVLTDMYGGMTWHRRVSSGSTELKLKRQSPFDAAEVLEGSDEEADANVGTDPAREALRLLSRSELERRADERRLPTKGSKDDLISRLLRKDYPQVWFRAGDRVSCRYRPDGDDVWRPAVVQNMIMDTNHFALRFEDGTEHTCSYRDLSMERMANFDSEWKPGDDVEAYWDEDGEWYHATIFCYTGQDTLIVVDSDCRRWEVAYHQIQPAHRLIPLRNLAYGQRLRGKVVKIFDAGCFVNVGAEQLAVMYSGGMFSGEKPVFKKGDYVLAFYQPDRCHHQARILHLPDKPGGRFQVALRAAPNAGYLEVLEREMKLLRPVEMDVGNVIDVWVRSVSTDKLEVVAAEDKVRRWAKQDVTPFLELKEAGIRLQGKVQSCKEYGLILEVSHPRGAVGFGLLHTTRMGPYLDDFEHFKRGDRLEDIVVFDANVENGELKFQALSTLK